MSTKRRPRKAAQQANLDARLDQALEETFPASDPVAITIEHVSFAMEPSPEVELHAAATHAHDTSNGG